MSFWLAFAVWAAGTAGLFYLDREKLVSSKALWLPVIWLWIIGSRPVSDWFSIWFGWGGSNPGLGLDAQLDGSPIDAAVFMALTIAAMLVLVRRRRPTIALLIASLPVLLFLLYCVISCLWSPFPEVAFKRWIKDIGDLAMVLVIATDPQPIAALRRVFSRVGFILFPASILLIRYSSLGQSYDPSGGQSFTGVTTNKNTLGLITFVILLGAVWSLLDLTRDRRKPHRARQLMARGILVAFGAAVLYEARSATSTSCFVLGSVLILAMNLSIFRRRPWRVHILVSAILLSGCMILLSGGEPTLTAALGRKSDLGDRTKIWAAAIPICPNPIIGAGFESFWNGYGKYVRGDLSKYEIGLNSAHNGYIEVYLNLGWVGVGLIAMLLIVGYQRAYLAFRRNPTTGCLLIAYVVTISLYSITEAGFRIMTPTWIAFLLVLVGSRRIASSVGNREVSGVGQRANVSIKEATSPELAQIS